MRQSLDKKDSISIETQIDECIAKIGKASYKVYIDKGYSGKNTFRPSFKEMMIDLKTGAIDQIIVYKLDRISRNVVDFVNMHETFSKYNATFVSCKEGFDSSTQLGRLLMMMLISFAQFERESIQERVKDNYYSRGSKGLYMGGRAPYGFTKIETQHNGVKTYTFEERPEQSIHLIHMYEQYATTDISLGRLSKQLNESGVLSAEGKPWDNSKISRILRSPAYVKANIDVYTYYKNRGCNITNDVTDFIGENGCYLYGKREANERKYTDVTDHYLSLALHKGLIDSDTWLSVQYKLDNNQQIKNTGQGTHTFLSGLLKCDKCGYAVCVNASKTTSKRYLNCKGKYVTNCCDGFHKTILAADVEEAAVKLLQKKAQQIRGEKLSISGNKNKSEINKLKIRLQEINKQIENLITNLAQGNNVVQSYINSKITELDQEKNKIDAIIQEKTLEEAKHHPIEEYLDKIDHWYELEFEKKKKICRVFIKQVRITEDNIKIIWTF